MNNRLLVAVFILAFQVSHALADEVYKCVVDGKTTYQSKPCKANSLNNEDNSGIFDSWQFGSTISQVKNTARERRLLMTPHAAMVILAFNEKVLNSKPESREYTYKTKIMDKPTVVTLFFTKTTERLYKIKARFLVMQLKPEERKYFYESLYSLLSKKYGESKNIDADISQNASFNPLQNFIAQGLTNTLIGTLLEWNLDKDSIITLSFKKNYEAMTAYDLTYQNIPLLKQNDDETTNNIKQRTAQSIANDAGKL